MQKNSEFELTKEKVSGLDSGGSFTQTGKTGTAPGFATASEERRKFGGRKKFKG